MIMNNVKRIRENNTKFLAQLKIDQVFFDVVLKDYDENGLRTVLAKLKQDQQKEKEKIDEKLKLEKRKDKQPTQEELKLFITMQGEIAAVEKKISEFSERAMGKEKGLKTISDIEKILEIIDGLSSSQRRTLNNL